jgi:hypothetical protein
MCVRRKPTLPCQDSERPHGAGGARVIGTWLRADRRGGIQPPLIPQPWCPPRVSALLRCARPQTPPPMVRLNRRGREPARAAQIARESLEHRPDEAGWRAAMQPLHDALAPVSGAGAPGAGAPAGGGADAAMAREEYLLGGQEGLDELLAALGGGGGGALVRAPDPLPGLALPPGVTAARQHEQGGRRARRSRCRA